MRFNNILMMTLAAASFHACDQPRTVEKPRYTARTVDAFEINRIELNKENTVVYLDVVTDQKKVPGFSDSTYLLIGDKVFPLIEARGIKFPNHWAGDAVIEDSPRPAELVFPALPSGTKEVDLLFNYSTKDIETAFWDIELTPSQEDLLKQVPVSAKENKINPESTWKEPVFDLGHTKLKIHLLGYDPKMEYVKVTRNGFMPWHEEYAVGKDGIINVEFDQYVTAEVEIKVGTRKVKLVVDPGEDANLYIDLPTLNLRHSTYFPDALSRPVAYYEGKSRVDLNRWLLNRQEPDADSRHFTWDKNTSMNAEQYAEYCIELYKKEVAALKADTSLNEECRHYLEMEAKMTAFRRIGIMRSNFMSTYGYSRDDKCLPEQTVELFRPLKDIGFNTYDLLLLNTYDMNLYLFTRCETADDVKAIFGEGYIADLFNATRHAFPRFNNKLPLREEEMKIMRTCSPKMAALCEEIHTEGAKAWKVHLAKPGYRICEVPPVQDSSVLESILEKYRGRVVFVDFWGTACVPCVRAIKEMHPLKTEYKDKPVSFIFITSETASPEEKWLQMIPDFGGDHYRLSRKQYKSLTKRFNIQFVPYYLLVDKQGNVVYQRTGFMGCPALKELLDKEIAK